jgi:hypothetical protein
VRGGARLMLGTEGESKMEIEWLNTGDASRLKRAETITESFDINREVSIVVTR